MIRTSRRSLEPPRGESGYLVDLEQALGRGLFSLLLPARIPSGSDLISGFAATPSTTTTPLIAPSMGIFGSGWRNDGTAARRMEVRNIRGFTRGLGRFSFAMQVVPIAPVTANNFDIMLVEPRNGSTSASRFLIYMNNSSGTSVNDWRWGFRSSAGTFQAIIATGQVVFGVPTTIVGTFDADSDTFRIYINGIPNTILSVAENPIDDTDAGANPTFFGNQISTVPSNASIHGFGFWRRVLAPDEVRSFQFDPYQMLAAAPRCSWIHPSAPGGRIWRLAGVGGGLIGQSGSLVGGHV